HTRSKRDWSSDVCSSDLRLAGLPAGWSPRPGTGGRRDHPGGCAVHPQRGCPSSRSTTRTPGGRVLMARLTEIMEVLDTLPAKARSEERRVGKECRDRRSP